MTDVAPTLILREGGYKFSFPEGSHVALEAVDFSVPAGQFEVGAIMVEGFDGKSIELMALSAVPQRGILVGIPVTFGAGDSQRAVTGYLQGLVFKADLNFWVTPPAIDAGVSAT